MLTPPRTPARWPAVPDGLPASGRLLLYLLPLIFPGIALGQVPPPAQTPVAPKAPPDTLTFVNGETLIGHFVRSNGTKVTFHSDMAGDVTVDWNKVKELRSNTPVAVIGKNMTVDRVDAPAMIPRGTLEATGETLHVQPEGAPPLTIPVIDTNFVIDEQTYERTVIHPPGFFHSWKGSVTGGISLVSATQHNHTFTGALNFVRTEPGENWLSARHRTTLNLTGAYGLLTQPGTPSVKTSIYHVDGEHDEYFTSNVYGFGQTVFDHNYSQGLNLEQRYGAGVGWTAVRRANEELDLKGSMSYVRQDFETEDLNQNLLGSTLEQTFRRTLKNGMVYVQEISATAAWNNLDAYMLNGNSNLTIPVYHRVHFTLGVIDTFLNNPSPGFHKNSFQFTTGLTYNLQ